MREGINLPAGSTAFERSLSGMKNIEKLQLGMEIWSLILCLWKDQALNTTIKCNLVRSLVLRQSTCPFFYFFYNACASSVVREKLTFSQQSTIRRRDVCYFNINAFYDIRKQIDWGLLGPVGSILISVIQVTCFSSTLCPLA